MSNNAPTKNQFISTCAWNLPSGQRVGWCFNLTTNELEDCWITETVDGGFKDDEEQTQRLSITRAAPLTIRDEVIADLERVAIHNNWQNFKHIHRYDPPPSYETAINPPASNNRRRRRRDGQGA